MAHIYDYGHVFEIYTHENTQAHTNSGVKAHRAIRDISLYLHRLKSNCLCMSLCLSVSVCLFTSVELRLRQGSKVNRTEQSIFLSAQRGSVSEVLSVKVILRKYAIYWHSSL